MLLLHHSIQANRLPRCFEKPSNNLLVSCNAFGRTVYADLVRSRQTTSTVNRTRATVVPGTNFIFSMVLESFTEARALYQQRPDNHGDYWLDGCNFQTEISMLVVNISQNGGESSWRSRYQWLATHISLLLCTSASTENDMLKDYWQPGIPTHDYSLPSLYCTASTLNFCVLIRVMRRSYKQ